MMNSASSGCRVRSRPSVANPDRLPSWDPQSEAGKRQLRREKLTENAVHVIPVVVTVCLAVLWIFSLPPESTTWE